MERQSLLYRIQINQTIRNWRNSPRLICLPLEKNSSRCSQCRRIGYTKHCVPNAAGDLKIGTPIFDSIRSSVDTVSDWFGPLTTARSFFNLSDHYLTAL